MQRASQTVIGTGASESDAIGDARRRAYDFIRANSSSTHYFTMEERCSPGGGGWVCTLRFEYYL